MNLIRAGRILVGIYHTTKFWARTVDMLVMPRTKQIESRILDLPLPFRPVMELKLSSLSIVSVAPMISASSWVT